MSLLRSSIFVAILSALVLTAYATDVLDYNCNDTKLEQKQNSKKPGHGKKAPAGANRCLCHQTFIGRTVEAVRVVPVYDRPTDLLPAPDEFPPEASPPCIDHPPQ